MRASLGESASSDSRSASSGRSICPAAGWVRNRGMSNVTELRVALTVEDFDQAVAFYRDALGLEQIADWSSATGRVVVLEAGRATLELFDRAQAESVDAIEAGRRVSGTVRLALQVEDSVEVAGRLVAAGPNGSRSPSPRRGETSTPGSRRRT